MTDRVNYLTVALENDMRSDDVQSLVNAIMQLRGVLNVSRNIADPGSWVVESRVKSEIAKSIFEILRNS